MSNKILTKMEKQKPVLNGEELIVDGVELKEKIAVEVANRFHTYNVGVRCHLPFEACCQCGANQDCILRKLRLSACAGADEAIRHFFKLTDPRKPLNP